MWSSLNKYLLSFYIITSVIVVSFFVYKTRKAQEIATGNAQTYPEEVQVQEVVVEGEGNLPSGFPHIPVYPGSDLITSSANDTYKGEWLVNQKLSFVVAWFMGELYNDGWYMTSVPENPSSETSQSFTSGKEGKTLKAAVTSGSEGTVVSLEITK